MGNDFCSCSKPSIYDSDMNHIARLQAEDSIGLQSDKETRNKQHAATPYVKLSNKYDEQTEGQQHLSHSFTFHEVVPIKPYIMKCKSIRECEAIKRIIKCLQFYEKLNIESYSRLITYFDIEKYHFLLEDYNHILYKHIGDTKKSLNASRTEFEYICNLIIHAMNMEQCNINTCDKFKRNNRLREEYKNNAFIENDKLLNYYIETLDIIHCIFIHSFDCGYRLKMTDFDVQKRKKRRRLSKRKKRTSNVNRQLSSIVEETKSQCDVQEDYDTMLFIDEQLINMKNVLNNKRKYIKSKNNKFMTQIPQYIIQNKLTQTSETEINMFGRRYYYWKYYEKCNDRDKIPNDGYNVNDWYINKKYEDLEEEMHDNNIYKLEYERFKEIVFISSKKIQCQYARNIIANGECMTQYGMGYNQSIKIKHIQAVLIYTNFQQLAIKFCESFKRYNINENDNDLKTRASEFWHLSKLLRETVDLFGFNMEETKILTFYHNINNKFPFESMTLNLGQPISNTIYLEIATLFNNDNGIIIEIEKDDDILNRYFDCSWLSPYNTGERLFFGAQHPFRFKGIRSMKSNINYEYFIHAISIFDYSINGKIPHSDATVDDLQIIAILIDNRKDLADDSDDIIMDNINDTSSKHMEYINNIFYNFCMNKHEIIINIWNMSRYYSAMQQLLFYDKTKNKNLVVFSNLCKIFKKCKKISIEFYQYDKVQLDETYFQLLLDELQVIPQLNQQNLLIELIQVKYTTNILEKYKAKFVSKSWFIEESDEFKISIFKMSMSMFSQK